MLVAHDNSWVMAMPSKCGSSGMYNLQKATNFCRAVGAWHGGYKMDFKERNIVETCKARLLLVREPLSRLVSLYWFIINEHYQEFTRKCLGLPWFSLGKQGDHTTAFNLFCEWLPSSEAQRHRMFWLFSGYVNRFKPTRLIRMETDLERFLRKEGGKELSKVYSTVGRNQGRGKPIEETVGSLSDRAVSVLLGEYCSLKIPRLGLAYSIPPRLNDRTG